MGVAYTSNGGGVYVQWGWRLRPIGVVYTSKGAKVAYKSRGPMIVSKNVLEVEENVPSFVLRPGRRSYLPERCFCVPGVVKNIITARNRSSPLCKCLINAVHSRPPLMLIERST